MASNSTQNFNKAKDEVKAAAGEVKRDAQNAGADLMDRAKDVAGNVADKAKSVASTVGRTFSLVSRRPLAVSCTAASVCRRRGPAASTV